MPKCKKCGTESNGRFCPECGAPIVEHPSEVKESEAVATAESAAPLGEVIVQPTTALVQQSVQPSDKPIITVLAGSKIKKRYLNKRLSTILLIIGTLVMIVGVVFGVVGGAIAVSDVLSKAYPVISWYDGNIAYYFYSVTPQHYNKVVLLLSLSSFVISAGLAVWAVRKMIVYPELAKLLNGTEVNSAFIYYEGLNVGQKKSVDAQCSVNKTYRTIRLLTHIGAAIIACCSIIYWINGIGLLTKYYKLFIEYLNATLGDIQYTNHNAYIEISFCSGVIIAFLVVLLVYDIVFVIVRKKLNAKACQQLKNVKL